MASPVILPFEDKDLDDADLWAVIDSAAAFYSTTITTTPHAGVSTSRSRKPPTLKPTNCRTPQILHSTSASPSPQLPKSFKVPRHNQHHSSPSTAVTPYHGGGGGEVLDSFDRDHQRYQKISRSSFRASEVAESSPSAIVKHAQVRSPATPIYSSPGSGGFTGKEISPYSENLMPFDCVRGEDKETTRQIALGRGVSTVNLFKEYQDTAMAILEKSDYTMISGNPYIKKSGWRKMAFYFNVSFEIKDKTLEFDDKRNVQRAEFLVRAHMPSGRFSDGWGSCERNEKRFMKPNNDIPTTAETRAKNRACQDLLGIGHCRPGANCKP